MQYFIKITTSIRSLELLLFDERQSLIFVMFDDKIINLDSFKHLLFQNCLVSMKFYKEHFALNWIPQFRMFLSERHEIYIDSIYLTTRGLHFDGTNMIPWRFLKRFPCFVGYKRHVEAEPRETWGARIFRKPVTNRSDRTRSDWLAHYFNGGLRYSRARSESASAWKPL